VASSPGLRLFCDTCSTTPVLRHLRYDTCSTTPVPRHLFHDTCSKFVDLLRRAFPRFAEQADVSKEMAAMGMRAYAQQDAGELQVGHFAVSTSLYPLFLRL
jgi:hypothetical protein